MLPEGVRRRKIFVASSALAILDQGEDFFGHFGIRGVPEQPCNGVEPIHQRILAVKSTVHFRADFDAIAEETLIVEAPGAHPCRLTGLDYRRLRAGVRLGPGGPAFEVRRAG